MTNNPPTVGDFVTVRGSPVVCVVTGVNTEMKTVDVKATRDAIISLEDVPWATIFCLDEGQSGLRIITQASDKR